MNYIILYQSEWYIVKLGMIKNEAWWCERDGSAVCEVGVESRVVDLRHI